MPKTGTRSLAWKKPYRHIRRKRNWKRKPRFSKSLVPTMKIHNFKREVEQSIDLYNPEGPPPGFAAPFELVHTADGGVVGNLSFTIADLPNYTEFTTGLFKQYRMNAVKMTIITSANTSQSGEGAAPLGNPALNVALLGQTMYNRTGSAMGSGNTIADWNQVQAKKRFTLYKKKDFYFKLNQLNYTQERGGTLTGYGVQRPQWHDVTETAIDHFGINLRFDAVSGQSLASSQVFPVCKIIFTYYLQLRGVK
jgi:hypothetical protein